MPVFVFFQWWLGFMANAMCCSALPRLRKM
jgi:hypothetical protein